MFVQKRSLTSEFLFSVPLKVIAVCVACKKVAREDTLNWFTRIIKTFSILLFSLVALDFSACLCVANTIQPGAFSTFIADHIVANKLTSVGEFSLVHQLGEHLMDNILQFVRFSDEDNLLLLSAWFDSCCERVVSTAIFEEAVGRLINRIDCTNFDSKFINGVLGKPNSRFSTSERCRWANTMLVKLQFCLALQIYNLAHFCFSKIIFHSHELRLNVVGSNQTNTKYTRLLNTRFIWTQKAGYTWIHENLCQQGKYEMRTGGTFVSLNFFSAQRQFRL